MTTRRFVLATVRRRKSARRDGWTSDDELRLVRMRDDGASWDDIALALRRTPQAVALRAFRLGITDSRPRWTPEDDAQLIALRRAGYTWRAVAAQLGRTSRACSNRAWYAGMTVMDGELGDCYGRHGTITAPPVPPPEPEPTEYVLVVENDDWHTAIARGDRAEIERIYSSMHPRVIGLRIEAVTP